MAQTLEGITSRLACNVSSRDGVLDSISGDEVVLLKGVEAQIQCALFLGVPSATTFIDATANIFGIDFFLRQNGPSGTVLLHKTINGSAVNDITYANWIAGTAHQFEFEMTSTETNQSTPSDGTQRVFFYIVVTTNIKTYVAAFGYGQIQDVGVTNVSAPIPPTFVGVYVDGNGVVQNAALDFTGAVITGLDFGLGGLIVDQFEVRGNATFDDDVQFGQDVNVVGNVTAAEFVGNGANITNVTAPHVDYVATGTGGTSRTVANRFAEQISVVDYGAVTGNTAAANTLAFNRAIAAAGSKPTIFVPAGIFRVGLITIPTHCTIIGAGAGSTVLKAANAATSCAVATIPNTSTQVTFRDLTLDGNRGNINISPLQFDYIVGSNGTHVLFDHVEITGSESIGAFVGDNSVDATNNTFRTCWIHANGGMINSTGYGNGIFSGGSVLPTNLTIEDCTIENNYNTITQPNDSCGVNLTVGKGCKIINNTFRNNYNVNGGQLFVGAGGDESGLIDTDISGNFVYRTGSFGSDNTAGIEIGGSHWTCSKNIIEGANFEGIIVHLQSAYGVIANNLIDGGSSAITLYGGGHDPVSHISIADNVTLNVPIAVQLNMFNRNILVHDNDFSGATDSFTVFEGTYDTLHASVVDYDNLTIFSSPKEVRTASATAVSIPTNLANVTITFLDLPKGTWDVGAGCNYNKATNTKIISSWLSLSLTNNLLDLSIPGEYHQHIYGFPGIDMGPGATASSGFIPIKRYRLNSTTRIYLVAGVQFDTSTMSVSGKLTAKSR